MLPAICRSKLFRPGSQSLTFRCEDIFETPIISRLPIFNIIIIKRLNSQLRNYTSNGYERHVLQKHFI